MQKAQLDELHGLLKEMEVIFCREDDIHLHTKRLGDICRKFLELDDLYLQSLAKAKNANQTYDEIMQQCPPTLQSHISKTLQSIRAEPGADNETKLSVEDLLRRTWHLSDTYSNAQDLVIENLNHNTTAGGGCLPGIAARLVQPYTAFVYSKLEKLYIHMQGTTAADEPDDQDLAQALLNSLQATDDPFINEDLQIAEALNQSLASVGTGISSNQQPLLFSRQEVPKVAQDLEKSSIEAQKAADEEYAIFLHLALNEQ